MGLKHMSNIEQQHQLKHEASQSSLVYQVWGLGPSSRYEELASIFRPV